MVGVQDQVIAATYEDVLVEQSRQQDVLKNDGSQVMNKVGTLLGAVGLITGSSVGAGILALPSVASEAGYMPTIGILGLSWVLLTTQSLLLAEVNINMRSKATLTQSTSENKQSGEFISIPDMAHQTLGPAGGIAAKLVYIFLATTLLVAYTSKAGDVLETLTQGHFLGKYGSTLFDALVIAGLIGNVTERTEVISRKVTAAMLVSFALLCGMGIPGLDMPAVSAYVNLSELPALFPVLYLSLVYHDLVPVVCDYLGGDAARIRTAILVGGCIPPMLFALFCAVTLSMVSGMQVDLHTVGAGLLDPLRVITQANPMVQLLVPMFCLFAVYTSCIGCSMGFAKFVEKELNGLGSQFPNAVKIHAETLGQVGSDKLQQAHYNLYKASQTVPEPLGLVPQTLNKMTTDFEAPPPVHTLALAMIFVPVLVISQTYPELFFRATQLAGGYGMTMLYGVLPPIMASKMRNGDNAQTTTTIISASQLPSLSRSKTMKYQGVTGIGGGRAAASFEGTVVLKRASKVRQLVPGGQPVLTGLVTVTVGIILNQVALDLGFFKAMTQG